MATTTKTKRPGKPTTRPAAPVEIPNPGQALVCRGCVHFTPEAWNAGHPSPCLRVRWEGQKHFKPTLGWTRPGRVKCSDFKKRPK